MSYTLDISNTSYSLYKSNNLTKTWRVKYIITALLFFNLSLLSLSIFSKTDHHDYHETMAEYIKTPESTESTESKLKLINTVINNKTNTTKLEFTFTSQAWPKNKQARQWQHHVNIYIPEKLEHHTALLWINGGTSNPPINSDTDTNTNLTLFKSYPIEFDEIANRTKSIIIDLQDIPNQYITLDNKQLAEDALMAYSATKFISNPVDNKYYSAYLPMVKAVVKTMDATAKINYSHYNSYINKNFKINNFVLSGLSKRGLTTWLTALQDDRVKAIIPAAIDILNTQETILHIFHSYTVWPIALHDYKEHKMLENLEHKNFNYLMQINDPYQYIICTSCTKPNKDKYRTRISIEKFIIISSGDDFFVPDSSKFYFNSIPGKKHLRVIPNAPHHINNQTLSDTVLTYFDIIINNKATPEINSKLKKNITSKNTYDFVISATEKPKYINLYTAYNPDKRDFRLASGIKYNKITLSAEKFNKYIAKRKNLFSYTIKIDKPDHGWKAFFVELEYAKSKNNQKKNNIPNIILTSDIEILPKNYPKYFEPKYIKNAFQYGKQVLYPVLHNVNHNQ